MTPNYCLTCKNLVAQHPDDYKELDRLLSMLVAECYGSSIPKIEFINICAGCRSAAKYRS